MISIDSAKSYYINKTLGGSEGIKNCITVHKLMKLIYFSNVESMGIYGEELVRCKIRKLNGGVKIDGLDYSREESIIGYRVKEIEYDYSERELEVLENVWGKYGLEDSKVLSELINQTDGYIETEEGSIISKMSNWLSYQGIKEELLWAKEKS